MLRNKILTMIFFLLPGLLAPAANAVPPPNQWTGTGPFATGLGNRVISALAVNPGSEIVYSGTVSGTVFSYAVTPPAAATGGAATGATGATLNGTVNANSLPTTVSFDYGADISYGSSVTAAQSPVTGSSATAVSAALTGLTPGVTYHYRVVAVNGSGVTNGLDATFTLNKLSQSITFNPLPDKTYGDSPFTVNASATSSLPVTFSSTTAPVCTVSGSTVAILAAGLCDIAADQAGNSFYNAASQVKQSFTVLKANQTIGAISLTPAFLNAGGTTTAGASATSNLAVNFSSTTPLVCTVNGAAVTGIKAGKCTVAADQPGDPNYNPAPRVTRDIIITGYVVTGTAVGNGAITCATPVDHGSSATCAIVPDPGYRLTALDANGSDILASVTLDQVTINNVTAPLTVTATFTAASYGGRAITSGSGDIGLYASARAADGTQHLVYERNGNLYYRVSPLVSGSWSGEESTATGHNPSIALKQDGAPVIAFISGGHIYTTTRSGASWSTPADTGVTGANSVEIAVDTSGHLHLAYTSMGSDGYDDILYTGNAGGSFGSVTTICHGAYASGVWTFCHTPQILADSGGSYHIVYNKQQINNRVGEEDPQWMVYTTNSGSGATTLSRNLNNGSGSSPQLLARGSFGNDTTNGYTLVYGNDLQNKGLWLASGLNADPWNETSIAVNGALPVQDSDSAALTRHLVSISPDGGIRHISRTASGYSAITTLAPRGELPFVNQVKRSVLYRANDANGISQLYQVGIGALALIIPENGDLGQAVIGQTVEKSLNLSNNGSTPLTVSVIETGNPGHFFEKGADNCTGQPLAPGASCAFTVKNSPQSATGLVTGALTITSDDPIRGSINLPLSIQVVSPYYPLAITVTGSGAVTAKAAGQSDFTCAGGVCSRNYDINSIVTLTAQATAGYTFTGFTFTAGGSAVCGGNDCDLTITGITGITATFSRNSYVISTLNTGNGTINCTSPVYYGNSGSCAITPDTGYRIEGVGGTCGGTLNAATYTTLPVTANCTVEALFVAATQRSLSVTLTGTGSGAVYSAPAGIACLLGTCSSHFGDATISTLTALPDSNSTFSGWSGACVNASGPCELTLNADKNVTADFTAAPNVKVGGSGYPTLSEAYAATINGSVIKARAIAFTEALILTGDIQVILEGGYNAPYDSNIWGGNTILTGSLTIEKGSVILDNLTIK